jgi:hypothetical protein
MQPDEAGRFESTAYPPGRYRVDVAVPAGSFLQSVLVDASEAMDRGIEVNRQDVHMRVRVASGTLPSLTCSVVDAAAAGEQAFVLVFPSDVRGWVGAGMPVNRLRFGFAADGRFTAEDLAPGNYAAVAFRGEVPPLDDPELFARLRQHAAQISVAADRINQIGLKVLGDAIVR